MSSDNRKYYMKKNVVLLYVDNTNIYEQVFYDRSKVISVLMKKFIGHWF